MTPVEAPTSPVPEGDRIAKVIARAGICSRREAERLITEGRVTVNGQVITSPALNVTGSEKIVVDGRELPAQEPTRLWRYYKEAGLVTTARDPEGRPTVFEKLPPGMPRVVSVGRLDVNTEGLLLLTNDGELARLLELPSTGWTRRYRVRAFGTITQADLDKLKNGITVEGVRYGSIEATLDKVQGANVWLTLGLKEGKNREVKRVLGALGLRVNRLIRLSFGPFQIGDMQPGEAKSVPNRVLLDQLGTHAARFERPETQREAQRETRKEARPEARKETGGTGPRASKPHAKAGVRPARPGGPKPKGETGWTTDKGAAGKPPARPAKEKLKLGAARPKAKLKPGAKTDTRPGQAPARSEKPKPNHKGKPHADRRRNP